MIGRYVYQCLASASSKQQFIVALQHTRTLVTLRIYINLESLKANILIATIHKFYILKLF